MGEEICFRVLQYQSILYEPYVTCDFRQCGILTSVDSEKPVQPLFKLRNSK